jgi:hypothetical protein
MSGAIKKVNVLEKFPKLVKLKVRNKMLTFTAYSILWVILCISGGHEC